MLISGIIVIGFFSFYFWTTRYFKAKAEQADKLQEFSDYKVRVGAMITSVVAGTIIVMMLSIWQSVPSENRMIAAGFILFALAWTCYAWFKWYRSRKRG
jgi:hypothetical protein